MTLAPGFGMEPTEPTLHPAGGPPPAEAPPPPTHKSWAPPPSTEESQLGSRGLRLIAFIVDSLLVSFIVGALWIVIVFFVAILSGGEPPDQMPIAGLFGVLIGLLYWPFFWSRDGQTLAMMPLGLRVVDQGSEETISFGRALLRLFGFFIDSIVLGLPLGYLWVFVDKRRRAWHDLIAGTIVIGEK